MSARTIWRMGAGGWATLALLRGMIATSHRDWTLIMASAAVFWAALCYLAITRDQKEPR